MNSAQRRSFLRRRARFLAAIDRYAKAMMPAFVDRVLLPNRFWEAVNR